jgi:hypothetical protein
VFFVRGGPAGSLIIPGEFAVAVYVGRDALRHGHDRVVRPVRLVHDQQLKQVHMQAAEIGHHLQRVLPKIDLRLIGG